MLKFNPQDTIDEANELAANFNDIDLHIFNTPEELPSEILSQIEHDGIEQNRVRAWIDMDNMRDVYLVASNVHPSDVSRTLGHEIIGHKGLRSVFGENFNTILDNVYNSHSEELIQYARTYNRDTETIENRRYLTEEFLSDCADANVKPSWWKEFIASLRQMLRRIFPKMRISDADINGWLSKAHRAVQNKTGGSVGNFGSNGARFNIGNDNSIDPEVRQAFPKYRSSQAKEVLKNFPKEGAENRDTGIKAQLNRRQRGKLFSEDAINKSKDNGFTYEQHLEAAANIQDLYENAVLLSKTDDLKNNDPNVKIYRFASPFVIGEEIADALLTVKESLDKDSKKIYSLELTEIIKPQGQATAVRTDYSPGGINKLQQKHEKVKQFIEKNQENLRFSISPVWTGSAADYDKPSLHAVGTGEGQQVYGWGLYGSESREVAEWYAKNDAINKSPAVLLVDGKPFRSATRDNLPAQRAMERLFYGYSDSIESLEEYYKDNIQNMEKLFSENISIDPYELRMSKESLQWIKDNKDKITFKPPQKIEGNRNIYRQTFWGDKEENLLDWDKDITDVQYNKIMSQLASELQTPDAAQQRIIEHLVKNKDLGFGGQSIYKDLSDILGSPKAASEFLYRAGIDGITYIGDSSGVRNYVAFSDEDIRIDEHIRFSVIQMSEDEQNDYVNVLKPFMLKNPTAGKSDVMEFLKGKGVNISNKEAWYCAMIANSENKSAIAKERVKRRNDWLYENVDLYRQVIDVAGSDFKIRPSLTFDGEDFTGSFISPEFRKYSRKRKQRNDESDKQYKNYLKRREKALANAEGMSSDEIAQAIAEKYGQDAKFIPVLSSDLPVHKASQL